MKFKLMACLFLLLSQDTFAGNVRDYHVLTNKAELAIVDNDLNSATQYYDSAFALRSKPFAIDAYNASICAIRVKQWEMAFHYANILADIGVGANFFKRNIYYLDLAEQKGWEELLARAEAGLKRKAAYKPLLSVIDSLVKKDQYVNHNWRASGMASKERQIMDLTYDTIAAHLSRIFDSVGFLSEDMIGASLSENGNEISYGLPFDVIIVHNYQSRRTGDTLFNRILRKALQEGQIKPDYYANIRDFGGGISEKAYYGSSHFYVMYKCSLYLEHYNKERLPAIEEARTNIGMGTTADYLKKLIYNIRYPSSGFMIFAPLSVVESYANKESEQRLLSDSDVIIEHIPDCRN